MKQKILEILKPKAKNFGFTIKEIESVAENIANNLKFTEDTSEEEKDEAINNAVEAAIPFFKLMQSASSRTIDEYRKKNAPKQEEKKEEDIVDANAAMLEEIRKMREENSKIIAGLQGEINSLKAAKTTDSRKAKLQAVLKDTGLFEKQTMRNFARMSFDNDESFEEYLKDVKNDLKDFNQERADAGLQSLGNPPGGGKKTTKAEPMSDAELEAFAEMFN